MGVGGLALLSVGLGLLLSYVKLTVRRENIERARTYPLAIKWVKSYNRMISWLWAHQDYLREDNEKAIAHPKIQQLLKEFYEVHKEVMAYYPDPEFDEYMKSIMEKYLKE